MTTQPNSIEAEQAVIGALLSDDSAWDEIADLLLPEHFADGVYRVVFGAVRRIIERGAPVDAVTVHQRLRDDGQGDLVSLPSLFDLVRATGTTANVRHYAHTVRDKWAYRERRRIAESILADTDENGPPEEKLAKDSSRLLAVETGKATTARKAGEVLMERLEALEKEAKAGIEDRWKRQVPTGIQQLDNLLNGMEPGELVLFAARPGVGKSAVAIAVSEHAGSLGIPTGVFWLEDYAKQWASRILSRRSLVPYVSLRHGSSLRASEWERLAHTVEQSHDWPIYLDDTHGMTARQIAQRMRRMHREHGCRLFIADHLGEMKLEREERWGERHDLSMGEAMRVYRDTAADLGAVPVLMAQLGRENEKRGGEPKLSDIYGSGIAEQVVRVAVFLSRTARGELLAHVVKNTNGPKPSEPIPLTWDGDTVSVRSGVTARPPIKAAPRYVPGDDDDAG